MRNNRTRHSRSRPPSRASRTSGGARIANTLMGLFLLVFALGGVYFGCVFVNTVGAVLQGNPNAFEEVRLIPPILTGDNSNADPAATKEPALPEWKGRERVNILLLGLDQRDDERGQPSRTDTMLVVSIDPATKSAGMLSMPRDLWVEIPGYGQNRINTAHFLGDAYKYPGGGPALAKRTVQLNLGVPIHYYARIDFRAFESIVDAIGGINVDVDKPVRDDEYPTEDYGIQRIYIPAGLQHLNGQSALYYVRSRHGDSDFGRARRQQKLLIAAAHQALQLNMLPKAPQLINTFKDSVATDMSVTEMLALAKVASTVDPEMIIARVISEDMAPGWTTAEGAAVLVPDRTALAKVVGEVFGTAPAALTPKATAKP